MRGIEFRIVWFDQDVLEYQVTCSNGVFSGATNMYLAYDQLAKAADALSGFPSNSKDSRHITLGAFDPNVAGGGIDMTFRSTDSVGHAQVIVKLTTEQSRRAQQSQSVSLHIPIEANSIDSFVKEARTIDVTMRTKASLLMAGGV